MASKPTEDFRRLVHHSQYYLNDGNLHLLAENTLFRVHSYFFTRESPRFRDNLESPPEPGQECKGSSDSNALLLDNVTAEEFSKFLWVFYDPSYSRTTTVHHWTIILELAHRWVFPGVKELAMNSLENLDIDLVQRIALYQKYNAPENILHPHYAALCARPQMLKLGETEILGSPTTIMIFSVRERLLSVQSGICPVEKLGGEALQRCIGSYFSSQRKAEKKDTKPVAEDAVPNTENSRKEVKQNGKKT